MGELTRRAALQRGLGAGLAVVLSSGFTASPARAAVTNRVRLTSGVAHGAARTSARLAFPAPAAGNLLLAVLSVDGSAGAFTPPSGWRIAFQRVGTSLSAVAMYRVATGSETTLTLPWLTSSPGGSWLVAEYTGINATDPVATLRVPPYSDYARTGITLDPPVVGSPGVPLAVLGIDAMDTAPVAYGGAEFRPTSSGWNWVATSYASTRPDCPGTALTEHGAPLRTGQDLPATSFAWQRKDQVIGALLHLNTTPNPPALVSRWVGAVTPTSATVAVKAVYASTARLRVSVDPALATGVVLGAAAAPDRYGMTKLVVGGLQPGTQYTYAVDLDGTPGTATGRFRTAPGAAGDFVFAFASCCKTPEASAFSSIREHDPDFFLHLGDLHYGDISVDDPAAFRARYDTALASPHQGPLHATVPTLYSWSDHDFGTNGSDGTSASRSAAQATYRQYVPSHPLPSPTGGIYQTFSHGRVRFVITDNRSYKTPKSAVDDARKTMLGAEQKQWFKDTIAAATEPVVIWVNENPWVSPVSTTADWWGAYSTERAELADFIVASGTHVAIVSGDMHALAADDGTHSPGGIPVFHAAALSGNSSRKGGPYTHGPFPATAGVPVEQYGVMRVVDTGATIALQFTGYQVGGVAALSYTHTFRL